MTGGGWYPGDPPEEPKDATEDEWSWAPSSEWPGYDERAARRVVRRDL